MNREKTCCFFGHRKIEKSDDMIKQIKKVLEFLICEKKIDTFLFGSKSEFDALCRSILSELKMKYPHIKLIYVRAECPYIDDDYRAYLLQYYDDTYFPQKIIGAGKASYVERNCEMINNSVYSVVYYDKKNTKRVSGTKLAYDYAEKKNVKIINVIKRSRKQ